MYVFMVIGRSATILFWGRKYLSYEKRMTFFSSLSEVTGLKKSNAQPPPGSNLLMYILRMHTHTHPNKDRKGCKDDPPPNAPTLCVNMYAVMHAAVIRPSVFFEAARREPRGWQGCMRENEKNVVVGFLGTRVSVMLLRRNHSSI